MKYDIVDTRPYSENKNKNELLFYVEQMITYSSDSKQKLGLHSLQTSIIQMLENQNYLGLSVALSLAPSRRHYQILFDQLNDILLADKHETQFIIMPLVMVLGVADQKSISLFIPREKLQHILQNIYGDLIKNIHWLDHIILAEHLSRIKADEWYLAKRDYKVMLKALEKSESSMIITPGYQVELGFLVGYGPSKINSLVHSDQNIMLIMQFWNEYFIEKNITPFVNPLPLNTPLQGLVQGSYFRKKMDLDIFVTNTIRGIKLAGGEVAVVIGTKKGGGLEVRIQVLEDDSKFSTYHWQLTSSDNLFEIIDDLIDLLIGCLIKNIWVLKNPIEIESDLPSYHQSIRQEGVNPTNNIENS